MSVVIPIAITISIAVMIAVVVVLIQREIGEGDCLKTVGESWTKK